MNSQAYLQHCTLTSDVTSTKTNIADCSVAADSEPLCFLEAIRQVRGKMTKTYIGLAVPRVRGYLVAADRHARGQDCNAR